MNLILASSNAHKALEFSELFAGELQVTAAPSSIEVDETGKTFEENSFLKAKAYYEKFKVPALADDSGLVIEEWPELLGVYSARFAPELHTYPEKCQKLLKMMDERGLKTRAAYFVCTLCFFLSPEEVYFFEGRVHGTIGHELKGSHGFGYDPVFVPERKENDGLTLAELPEWKNENSHRARAVQSALSFFKESSGHKA
jgi:XTP/dITP diphosphohydrolase